MIAQPITKGDGLALLDALLDPPHRKTNLGTSPVDNRKDKPFFPEGEEVGAVLSPPMAPQPRQTAEEAEQAERAAEGAAEQIIEAATTATASRHALAFPTWGGSFGQTTRPTPRLRAERPRRGKTGEVLRQPSRIGDSLRWIEEPDGRSRPAYKSPGALYWADWHTWLTVAAYRWLNSQFRAGAFAASTAGGIGRGGPTVEELRRAFAVILDRHALMICWYEVGMGNAGKTGFRDVEEIDRLAYSASRHVAETWDADYIEQRVEWGRKGGQASSRGPKAFQAFLALPGGLSQQQQADALGVNVRTVRNYQRKREQQG